MYDVKEVSRGEIRYDSSKGKPEDQWKAIFPHHSFEELFDALAVGIVTPQKPNCAKLEVNITGDPWDIGAQTEQVEISFSFSETAAFSTDNATELRLSWHPSKKEMSVDILPYTQPDMSLHRRPTTDTCSVLQPYALANAIDLIRALGVTAIPPSEVDFMGATLWSKLGLEVRPRPDADLASLQAQISERWAGIKLENPGLPAELVKQVDGWVADFPHHISKIAALKHRVFVTVEIGEEAKSYTARVPLGGELLMDMELEVEGMDVNHMPEKITALLERLQQHRSAANLCSG